MDTSLNKNFICNDGGRSLYFKGSAKDCGVRAMAIALQIDYRKCYTELAEANKNATGRKSAREGLHKETFNEVLARYGWVWHSAPSFKGRAARCGDLSGRVIARQAKHFVAVIDGIPNDIFDSSHKMVYGYWKKQEKR